MKEIHIGVYESGSDEMERLVHLQILGSDILESEKISCSFRDLGYRVMDKILGRGIENLEYVVLSSGIRKDIPNSTPISNRRILGAIAKGMMERISDDYSLGIRVDINSVNLTPERAD